MNERTAPGSPSGPACSGPDSGGNSWAPLAAERPGAVGQGSVIAPESLITATLRGWCPAPDLPGTAGMQATPRPWPGGLHGVDLVPPLAARHIAPRASPWPAPRPV